MALRQLSQVRKPYHWGTECKHLQKCSQTDSQRYHLGTELDKLHRLCRSSLQCSSCRLCHASHLGTSQQDIAGTELLDNHQKTSQPCTGLDTSSHFGLNTQAQSRCNWSLQPSLSGWRMCQEGMECPPLLQGGSSALHSTTRIWWHRRWAEMCLPDICRNLRAPRHL